MMPGPVMGVPATGLPAQKNRPNQGQQRNAQHGAQDNEDIAGGAAHPLPTDNCVIDLEIHRCGRHCVHAGLSFPIGAAGSSSASVPAERFKRRIR